MRLFRRICATALVASVALLAACSESATTTPTNDADLAVGTREFEITPNNPTWTKQPADPLPTDARTVLISGLIAVASYPQFGTPVYTGTSGWLDMNLAPNFSRTPLGWVVTFRLKPSAAALPIGRYTATIPVTVPAAVNNPQVITVVYSNCDNCLFIGDNRNASLTNGDPTWNRNSTFNNTGSYHYDDWRIFVPANTTVRVDMIGSPCGNPNYTLSDPYQYVFTTSNIYITQDDDGGCGYNSILYITNSTGTQQEYLLRATEYSAGQLGTYNIAVTLFSGGGLREREPGDKETPSLLTTKF